VMGGNKKYINIFGCFMEPLNYLYFRNHAVNFVEIGSIYTNQMIVQVAVSTINSAKLGPSYDDLYLGITFPREHGVNEEFLIC